MLELCMHESGYNFYLDKHWKISRCVKKGYFSVQYCRLLRNGNSTREWPRQMCLLFESSSVLTNRHDGKDYVGHGGLATDFPICAVMTCLYKYWTFQYYWHCLICTLAILQPWRLFNKHTERDADLVWFYTIASTFSPEPLQGIFDL